MANSFKSLFGSVVARLTIAAVAPVFIAGCSSAPEGPTMCPVSGTVSFDSEPVSEGRIQFRKAEGDQKAFSGDIKDGKYSLETEAGKMTVAITASRPSGKFDTSNPDDPPQPIGEMYIPKKYNDETTLTAEVTTSGENVFPFELAGK